LFSIDILTVTTTATTCPAPFIPHHCYKNNSVLMWHGQWPWHLLILWPGLFWLSSCLFWACSVRPPWPIDHHDCLMQHSLLWFQLWWWCRWRWADGWLWWTQQWWWGTRRIAPVIKIFRSKWPSTHWPSAARKTAQKSRKESDTIYWKQKGKLCFFVLLYGVWNLVFFCWQ